MHIYQCLNYSLFLSLIFFPFFIHFVVVDARAHLISCIQFFSCFQLFSLRKILIFIRFAFNCTQSVETKENAKNMCSATCVITWKLMPCFLVCHSMCLFIFLCNNFYQMHLISFECADSILCNIKNAFVSRFVFIDGSVLFVSTIVARSRLAVYLNAVNLFLMPKRFHFSFLGFTRWSLELC